MRVLREKEQACERSGRAAVAVHSLHDTNAEFGSSLFPFSAAVLSFFFFLPAVL